MKAFPKSVTDRLEDRKKINAFRTLTDATGLIDFFSNDYLGLSTYRLEAQYPLGSTGSRLISGNSNRTEQIENELAGFFNQASGIFFNSGYDANIGLFSAIPERGDTVIYDELIHASIRDGVRLGNAKTYSFKHNDLVQLKDKLDRATGAKYVAVEAVYSMDGDKAPLKEIAELCEQEGAFLIVDEAHSGGIIGESGEGLVSALGLDARVFAKVMTFGKAYGSHGAIVLGNRELRDFLINFARSLIYTTALSPHSQERISQVVAKASAMKAERISLSENVSYFKELMSESNFEIIPSDSAIQSVIVPGNNEVKELAKKIWDAGLATKSILHPTVPLGRERLRFCIHSYNTNNEILKLVNLINE